MAEPHWERCRCRGTGTDAAPCSCPEKDGETARLGMHWDWYCEKPQPLLSSQVRQHQHCLGTWKRTCCFFLLQSESTGMV